MNYKFNKDGNWIEAKKEVWCWEAYYTDNGFLKQFGDDGIFHQFHEIDQSKLKLFKMVHETKPPFTLLFNPNKMKLIHFYRNTRLYVGSPQENFTRTYCFGYEVKTAGKVNKFMVMLLTSGETVITEDCDLISFE